MSSAEAKLVEAKQKEKESWENEKKKLIGEINELKSRASSADKELKNHIESSKNIAKIEIQLKSEVR